MVFYNKTISRNLQFCHKLIVSVYRILKRQLFYSMNKKVSFSEILFNISRPSFSFSISDSY